MGERMVVHDSARASQGMVDDSSYRNTDMHDGRDIINENREAWQ